MNLERARALQELSWELQAAARLEEADAACREALAIVEASEGPASADVANLLNDLAEITADRGDIDGTLAVVARALSIESNLHVEFAADDAARIRIRTLTIAAAARRMGGSYVAAERDLLQALSIGREMDPRNRETAQVRNDLAVLYKCWGRFDEALRQYRDALHAIVATCGPQSIEAATVYHNIGGLLHAQGKFAEAEAPARQAWEVSRDLLGDAHVHVMVDATAYAAVLDGLERFAESEPIYSRALDVFERVYGEDHLDVAGVLHNLAAVRHALGDRGGAEHAYRRALAIKDRVAGPESPESSLTRNNLGRLLVDLDRASEAEPLLAAAVLALSRRLEPDHPHFRRAIANLRACRERLASGS